MTNDKNDSLSTSPLLYYHNDEDDLEIIFKATKKDHNLMKMIIYISVLSVCASLVLVTAVPVNPRSVLELDSVLCVLSILVSLCRLFQNSKLSCPSVGEFLT